MKSKAFTPARQAVVYFDVTTPEGVTLPAGTPVEVHSAILRDNGNVTLFVTVAGSASGDVHKVPAGTIRPTDDPAGLARARAKVLAS